MNPHSLAQQILIRSFWFRVSNPGISDADARNAAAAELAQEHREQAKHERKPLPRPQPHRRANDPRSRLLGRMLGMLERLAARRVEPAASPPKLGEMPTARPSFFERVMAAFEPEPTPPQPEPAQSPTILAEGSSAVLISDDEYVPGLRSVATANWRASIESNIVKFDERRGTKPTSRYVG
jgi:hypothetical protein